MARHLIDRRNFIGSAASAAAFFAMHDVAAATGQNAAAVPPPAPRPRILALELQAAAAADERDEDVLWQDPRPAASSNEKGDRFTVEAGETQVTFVSAAEPPRAEAPFYHFAFNIPENKICRRSSGRRRARPAGRSPSGNRAAGYPPEVVDYRHWNAHSVFFLDPAGNVVEYIARHDLKNGDSGPFGWTRHPLRERDRPGRRRRRGNGGQRSRSRCRAAVQGRQRSVHRTGRRVRTAACDEARSHHRLHRKSRTTARAFIAPASRSAVPRLRRISSRAIPTTSSSKSAAAAPSDGTRDRL